MQNHEMRREDGKLHDDDDDTKIKWSRLKHQIITNCIARDG